MPLTMLPTGSLSSLLSGLEIAPSLSAKIPSQLKLLLHKQSCRYTCPPLCLHVHHSLVFNIRSVTNNHKGFKSIFGYSAKP